MTLALELNYKLFLPGSTSSASLPPCDLLCICTKTTANPHLAELIGPALHSGAQILVLQNGLGNEAEIAALAGGLPIYGGLCFLCANKTAPAQIFHLAYGRILFGRHGGAPDHALETIAAVFADAGISTELAEDLIAARWHKLVWNVPFNGLSVVLDAGTDELVAEPAAKDLVQRLMREVQEGAASCNYDISDDFLQKMVDSTTSIEPYQTSMKIDADLKRPLELKHMFSNPLREASLAGCVLPAMDLLYRQLLFIDRRNRPH
jgi:2-dehydropantoate 2-reductase